jgi:tetratricopeptide (TPR) repeat protein
MEDLENRNSIFLAERFKEMISSGKSLYFDSDEMEQIVEYFFYIIEIELLEKAIEYAISLFPYLPVFRLYKAQKYILQLEFESAKKEMDDIEAHFPPFPDLFIEKAFLVEMTGSDEDDVVHLLEKAYELDKKNTDVLFYLAYENVKRSEIETALIYVFQLLEIDESYNEQFFAFSHFFEEEENYKDAFFFYQTITERFPLIKGGWFGLGITYSWLNQHEEAIKNFELAISLDENMPAAHFNMGNSYFELQKYEKALDEYFTTLNLDGMDFNTMTAIADCYFLLAQYDEAMEYYRMALDVCPNHNDAIMGIITILNQQGKDYEIRAFMEKAFEAAPQNFELLFNYLDTIEDAQEKQELLYTLFDSTLKHIENKNDFFEFFTRYCCENQMVEFGISIIIKNIDLEDIAKMADYYLAALYYTSNNYEKGNFHLTNGMMVNFEGISIFLTLSAVLKEIPHITEIIDHIS